MGKILIIDDEKQMLALLSRILELEGYEVYRTATCKAGLRQLQVNTPEVVLRDVCLPDGNGIELIDRMKNIFSCSGFTCLQYRRIRFCHFLG